MTKKRLIQFLIITVVAVWIFSASMLIGMSVIRKNRQTQPLPTIPTSSTTAAPTTEALPAVTIDGNRVDSGNTPQTTTASLFPGSVTNTTLPGQTTTGAQPTQASVPSGKTQIVNAYIQAINALKGTPDFTLIKKEDLNVIIDEMTPASVRSMANRIIESNKQTSPVTYRFSGGMDAASGLSPNAVIAPISRSAALNEAIVTAASATPQTGGGYTLHLTLGRETQTMNTPAPNYSGCMQVIQADAMGLPSTARVDDFTVVYDNSTIDATIDSQGRITAMTHHLNVVSGEGNGSLVMAVTAKMHGEHTGTYTITY